MPPRIYNQISPLASWGSFSGQKRLSDSPYVESVWEGVSTRDGVHLTAADGTFDLTFQTRRGNTRLLLSGPGSRSQTTTFQAGDIVLVIRLRTGVHLPFFSTRQWVNIDQYLPNATEASFWLQNTAVTFPTFNTVETFIDKLAKKGFVHRNIIVEDALKGRPPRVGSRTVQRHFLMATGMTHNHILQIRRAEKARNLLAGNHTLTQIAYACGYSNPGHMTNAFNHFFGLSPRALRTYLTR